MHMGVMPQGLAPGVKHSQKAEACSQMSRIGRDLKQGLGDGAKQESVEEALVLQTQGSESLGNGKHYVAVGDGQQFLGLLVQPAIASGRLALGTVPVATGVERDQPMSAGVALLQPTT
jgi:hypothetical protein